MTHTCHTPYCWLLSCAVCASCEACAEAYNARRPTLPARVLDDASAPAAMRVAVELLRATPTDDHDHTAWLDRAETKIAAKVRTVAAAKGGCS